MVVRDSAATAPAGVEFRPAKTDDLETCAQIWRISINDYTRRLNQPDIPDDFAAILRLYAHLRTTDPDGFVVAERRDDNRRRRIVAFVSALRREHLWFLSMLFVLPAEQGTGLGRALLTSVMPPPGMSPLATCTDTLQPISNALYAALGIPPRMPLLRLVGLPDRPHGLPPLPVGVRAVSFDEIAPGSSGGIGAVAFEDELAALDRGSVGFAHPEDHVLVRDEGRRGTLYLSEAGEPVGYGYASEAGRIGPVAVREAALLAPILGDLVTNTAARGAFGVWVPGAAGEATMALLQAGFRIDGFPVLMCWDRPIADFSRYIPISPGLL